MNTFTFYLLKMAGHMLSFVGSSVGLISHRASFCNISHIHILPSNALGVSHQFSIPTVNKHDVATPLASPEPGQNSTEELAQLCYDDPLGYQTILHH